MMLWLGAVAVLFGSVSLFLASPNQRLWLRPLPRRKYGWSGLVLIAAGVAALLSWAGPATAIFIALTIAMLAFTLVPVAVAWWRCPGGAAE